MDISSFPLLHRVTLRFEMLYFTRGFNSTGNLQMGVYSVSVACGGGRGLVDGGISYLLSFSSFHFWFLFFLKLHQLSSSFYDSKALEQF